jgi:transposase
LHSWSFADLRAKIAYKAALASVPVILVDPRNTSRSCPACGCVDKRNRPDQSTFSCVACGFAGAADHIAAINIGHRGVVNRPNVSDASLNAAPGTSPRLQPGVVDFQNASQSEGSICSPKRTL